MPKLAPEYPAKPLAGGCALPLSRGVSHFARFLFPKLVLIQLCIDAARSDELRVRAPFGDAIPR